MSSIALALWTLGALVVAYDHYRVWGKSLVAAFGAALMGAAVVMM